MATANQSESQVAVLDRKSGKRKTLVRGGSNAEYVDPGYLIYAAAGALRAVRFDPAQLEVLGDPAPVIDGVAMTTAGAAHYAVSRSGTLLYASGQAGHLTSLVWVDRKGREEAIKAPLRDYGIPRLSPDGTRVVVEIKDPGNIHLWIWDFARERLTPLTSGPGSDGLPVWTPDGRRIIFNSDRGHPNVRNLYIQAVDGTGTVERLTTTADRQYPTSISRMAWPSSDSATCPWQRQRRRHRASGSCYFRC
jgi:dipeptidyl aminopeptidase/acylaminoacyl peptidase